jgi:hypothetical protein
MSAAAQARPRVRRRTAEIAEVAEAPVAMASADVPPEVVAEDEIPAHKLEAMYRLKKRPGFKLTVPALPQTRTVKGDAALQMAETLGVELKDISLIRKLFDSKHPEIKRLSDARTAFLNVFSWLGYRCSFESGGKFLCTEAIETCHRRIGMYVDTPKAIAETLDLCRLGEDDRLGLADIRRAEVQRHCDFIRREHPDFSHWADAMTKVLETGEVGEEGCILFLMEEFERADRVFQRAVTYFNDNHYRKIVAERKEDLKGLFTEKDYPRQLAFSPTFRLVQLAVRDSFVDPKLKGLVTKQFIADYRGALDTIVGDIIKSLDESLAYLADHVTKIDDKTGLPHRFKPQTFQNVSTSFREMVERLGLELGFKDERLEEMLAVIERKVGMVQPKTINVDSGSAEAYRAGGPIQRAVDQRRQDIHRSVTEIRQTLTSMVEVIAPRRISRETD